ncbi:MAG: putative rane protein [Pedosphaera sp.]|nr:putative rane protein [Pedosphaera sp.]
MSTWRYVQNGQNCGPLEISALQTILNNGTISRDTLVWTEGMPNWVPANTIPELGGTTPPVSSSPAAGVPPVGGPGSAPPPIAPPAIVSDTADIEQNKVFAVLAYIGILFLVPLLAAPNSRFARFHTNQGIVLFLASIIGGAGSFVLMMVPFVGCFAVLLPVVVGVGSFVLMILGIINAATGQYKPLPLIGHFELIK